MENTISVQTQFETNFKRFPIFPQLKEVEQIFFDSAYEHTVIISEKSKFTIINNFTKKVRGQYDFVQVLNNCDELKEKFSEQLNQILKDQGDQPNTTIIDSFSFSQSREFGCLVCSKLATLFLIKLPALTGYINDDADQQQEQVEISGFIHFDSLQGIPNLKLKVNMDPESEYNCMIEGQNVTLSNFQSLTEKKLFNEGDGNQDDKSKKMLLKAHGVYVDLLTTKSTKTIICANTEKIQLCQAQFLEETNEYNNLQVLYSEHINIDGFISSIQTNPLNTYILLQYQNNVDKQCCAYYFFSQSAESIQIQKKFEYISSEQSIQEEESSQKPINVVDSSMTLFVDKSQLKDTFQSWAIILLQNEESKQSILWHNLDTNEERIQQIEDNYQIKNIQPNMYWRGSLICILKEESSQLQLLEQNQQDSWVNFAFKFKQIKENMEYVEHEDEFDFKDPDASIDQTIFNKSNLSKLEIPNSISNKIYNSKKPKKPFPALFLKKEEENGQECLVKESPNHIIDENDENSRLEEQVKAEDDDGDRDEKQNQGEESKQSGQYEDGQMNPEIFEQDGEQVEGQEERSNKLEVKDEETEEKQITRLDRIVDEQEGEFNEQQNENEEVSKKSESQNINTQQEDNRDLNAEVSNSLAQLQDDQGVNQSVE